MWLFAANTDLPLSQSNISTPIFGCSPVFIHPLIGIWELKRRSLKSTLCLRIQEVKAWNGQFDKYPLWVVKPEVGSGQTSPGSPAQYFYAFLLIYTLLNKLSLTQTQKVPYCSTVSHSYDPSKFRQSSHTWYYSEWHKFHLVYQQITTVTVILFDIITKNPRILHILFPWEYIPNLAFILKCLVDTNCVTRWKIYYFQAKMMNFYLNGILT